MTATNSAPPRSIAELAATSRHTSAVGRWRCALISTAPRRWQRNWAASGTRRDHFPGRGQHTLEVTGDDGVRLYVDDRLVTTAGSQGRRPAPGGEVARLERDHETSGYLCLKKDVVAQKGDERPREVLELDIVTVDVSGAATEYVQEICDENEAQHELTTGILRLRGIDHDIVWLDDGTSAVVLAEFF